MRKRTINFLLIVFLIPLTSHWIYAQETDSGNTAYPYKPDKAYFKSWLSDTRDIAIAPLHWKGNQWIGFSGVVIASAFVYTKDEQIMDVFAKNRSQGGDRFSKYALEPWGSGAYAIPLLALFYTDGLLFNHNRSKKTALLGAKTLLITAVYSRIPKYAFQRHRPYQDTPPDSKKWEGPLHGLSDYTSFMSGHAVSSFAVATIIASEYTDYPVVPFIAYALAGATSLSRIYDNKHWASDVLTGAVFGYAMGKLIYNKDNWMHRPKKPVKNDNY